MLTSNWSTGTSGGWNEIREQKRVSPRMFITAVRGAIKCLNCYILSQTEALSMPAWTIYVFHYRFTFQIAIVITQRKKTLQWSQAKWNVSQKEIDKSCGHRSHWHKYVFAVLEHHFELKFHFVFISIIHIRHTIRLLIKIGRTCANEKTYFSSRNVMPINRWHVQCDICSIQDFEKPFFVD